MRELTRFWNAVAVTFPKGADVPLYWRRELGDEHAHASRFLRPNGTIASSYPCPVEHGCSCRHEVVEISDDVCAAIPDDDFRDRCDVVDVPRAEAVLHELDMNSVWAGVADALHVSMMPAPVPWREQCFQLGNLGQARPQCPVYAIVVRDPEVMVNCVLRLMLDNDGPFVVVSPTSRTYGPECDAHIRSRKGLFIALDEHVGMTPDGHWVASRMPGVTRLGRPQYLLATNLGCPSWEAWMEHICADEDIPLPECWRDLRRNPPPLAPEIIHGILRKGHKLLLGGPSKAGKSYALIQLAAATAGGSSWLGHPCARGRVLYVNLEIDRASFVQRVLWIEGHMPFPPENLSVWSLRGRVMELKALKSRLIQWLRHQQPFDLIILDPIYKTNDGDENSARDMTAFCNSIESIATDTGAAVAFAHHFSKGQQGAKAAIDRASGSGVFGRDPDAVATLSELEGDDCAGFLLEWTLREFAAPPPVALLFQWPVHRVEKLLNDRKVKGAPGRPQAVTTLDIVNALDVVEGEPTIPAVAVHLGVSEKTVRNCVNRAESLLIDGGVIRFQKGQ